MNENSLRERLERATAAEPALSVSLDDVLSGGRRARRRRRLTIAAATTLGTAAAVTAAVVLVSGPGQGRPARVVAVTPFALTGSSPQSTTGDRLTADQRRIADAIRSSSPSGWTFALDADRWDGSGVEATADDGAGPGRLMVGISSGSQQLHPCSDQEFRAGVACSERTLADGSVLSLRDVVDWHGVRYTDVVLTHPDGSGVLAESGNFVIDWPLPKVVTPEEKKHLTHVTRPAPTYTVEQLADVVLAVNRAVS